MRVFYWVDHTAGCRINSGVQRVTRSLARALSETGTTVFPVVWRPEQGLVSADARQLAHLAKWNGPRLGNPPRGPIARLASLFQDGRVPLHLDSCARDSLQGAWLLVPEVTHITPHAAPTTGPLIDYCRRFGLRVAFVFYDALPLKFDLYLPMRTAHQEYMRELGRADLVLAISENSLRDYRASTGDTGVAGGLATAHAVSCPLPAEFPGVPRAVDTLQSDDKESRILSVGSIDQRKNQVALIKAFQAAMAEKPGRAATLTLVGGLSPEVAGQVREAAQDRGIMFRAMVGDDELIRLYRECTFTVFPSVEEGFGLPIAESLWFGKPCICADFGAMDEIARGGGCLQVDTRSEGAIREAIARMIDDRELRTRLAREARSRNLRTWHEYAAAVVSHMTASPGNGP